MQGRSQSLPVRSRIVPLVVSAILLVAATWCLWFLRSVSRLDDALELRIGVLVVAALLASAGCAFLLLKNRAQALALRRNTLRLEQLLAERDALAEGDRERQHRDFRAVLERITDGVVIVHQGRVLFANRAWLVMMGYSQSSEAVGRQLLEVLRPADPAAAEQALGRHRSELVVRKKGGGTGVLELSIGEPVEFEGVPAMVIATRDVTEQRRLVANLQLSDRMASIGTLAAGIGHQVNNPLAYVLSNLEFVSSHLAELSGGSELDREVRSALDDARDGANRVRDLVRELTAFSQPDDELLAPVELRSVVEESIERLRKRPGSPPPITVEHGDPPPVLANQGRLAHAVFNLLLSGAQAHDARALSVRSWRDPQGWAVLEIEETGAGLPRQTQDLIFDPFFGGKGDGKGMGLGLFVARHLITQLGGRLTVEGDGGESTRFVVELPPVTERRPEPVSAPAPGPDGGR